MTCPDIDKERKFIELPGEVTYYRIVNKKLILSNSEKALIEFSRKGTAD